MAKRKRGEWTDLHDLAVGQAILWSAPSGYGYDLALVARVLREVADIVEGVDERIKNEKQAEDDETA